MLKGYLLIVISILAFQIVGAQSIISGVEIEDNINSDVLEEKFRHYQIFRIDIRKEDINVSSKKPFVDLQLGSQTYHMNLYNDNLTVSYDVQNKPHLLGGSLRSGGAISLTINDNFIFGCFKSGNAKTFIEPLKQFVSDADSNLFLVYDVSDVIVDSNHKCGVDDIEARTNTDVIQKMMTTECKIVDYAIASTFNMVAATGSVTNLTNYTLAVLNGVQSNYRSEFNKNLEYDVVANYIPASASQNPLQPLTGSTYGSDLLDNFTAWAGTGGSANGSSGGFGIDFDMAGLWTATNIRTDPPFNDFGLVGLAWRPGWHHLLEYNSSIPEAVALAAHEIGHNWDLIHDGNGTFFIMAPSVTLTDNWSSLSESRFNARLSSVFTNHLTNCTATPEANFFHNIATCTNTATEFEDQSKWGATRTWEFTNGTPGISTDAKPEITYAATALNYVKITSSNTGGNSDDFEGYVDVQAPPPAICTPSGSGGTSGIQGVTLSTISTGSSATGIYEDYSCTVIGHIETSTLYNFRVRVNNVTRMRFFADYNNDGDFSDSGESIIYYNNLPSGNYNLVGSFTTPSSIVTGELIRFRIISSTSNISSNGCHVPSSGEVEDYSFYIEEPQILGCTDPSASNYDPNATVDDGTCTFGTVTWYRDFDGDTYGDDNTSQQAASQPPGYVLDNTDCDDNNANRFPGNPEVCDGIDNDCDDVVDEGVLITYYRDMDGDGFGDSGNTTQDCSLPSGYVTNNTDCDDNDADEFPGQTWYKDFDGDNYSDGASVVACLRPNFYFIAEELIATSGDCDDNNNNAFPGNPEVCDGVDNDCDMSVDEGVLNMYYKDHDGDTYGDPNVFTQACSAPQGYVENDDDCDDDNANAFPGNPEVCDGVDNNCNNSIDEGVMNTFYRDLDGDGFGDNGVTEMACTPPTGFVADNTDCDDMDADEFPGQIWYRDFDGDGYSNGTTREQCNKPNNFFVASDLIQTFGDCADSDPDRNPGETDICNDGIDNDCNGFTDELCGPCDGNNVSVSTISKDEYRANNKVISDAVLQNNETLLFTGANSIELNAGFEIKAGAVFLGIIAPCDN